MVVLLMLVVLMCGAVLQALVPTFTWLGQANVPVLLGVVLYYALAHEEGTMLQAAILAGLLQDALGMIPLGYSSFCFCVVALMVSRFKDIVFFHELVTHMLFGALAAGAVTLLLYGLLGKETLVVVRPGWATLKVAGSMLLGGLFAPLEYELLASLDRMLGNVEPKES